MSDEDIGAPVDVIADALAYAEEPKPTIEEMRDLASLTAYQLESSHRTLIDLGYRKGADKEHMRSIAIHYATARFLDAVIYQPNEVAKRLNGRARR